MTRLPGGRRRPRARRALSALFTLVLAAAAAQAPEEAPSEAPPALGYDVVVVGSEPEAVSAATAAAESGARTLLVSRDPRPGGLLVLGWLNVLDLRSQPFDYQGGLFARWWRAVGRTHAFDVDRGERAFAALLDGAGVDVRYGVREIVPRLGPGGRVTGVEADGTYYAATQTVDGTADMDLAAAAGADFTVGFASIGYAQRMVDTAVLRVDGVDWGTLTAGVRARGRDYAVVDDTVAWGHFGGAPSAYLPSEPGLRLRGLNLGRQDDGSVLMNALLVFDVDPFDPESRREARERAAREGPRLVAYLREAVPGFEEARFGGAAERLYVRESRHLAARCTLSVDDVLDNRVTPFDVAAGGYPLDVQVLSRTDTGFVFGTPDIYGVRLCAAVPSVVDGLWVVGRSAGFDPIAASSARVVPFGMAFAEAVGVAAAMASASGTSPAAFADTPEVLLELRAALLARGAVLPAVAERPPVGPWRHPHYGAYRTLLARGLAVGGYRNDPRLDEPVSALSFLYLLSNVGSRFFDERTLGFTLLERFGETEEPLTADLALGLASEAACALVACPEAESWEALRAAGLAPPELPRDGVLTRGEAYALAARLAARAGAG